MDIQDVLSRFESVQKEHDGYRALCPAHEDKNPSLSISGGSKGIVLHCFAGCKTDDILSAVGLKTRDLFNHTPSPKTMPIILTPMIIRVAAYRSMLMQRDCLLASWKE